MNAEDAKKRVEEFPVFLDQELARCSADQIPDYFRFEAKLEEYIRPIFRYADSEYHKGNRSEMQLMRQLRAQLSARKLRDERAMERLANRKDRRSLQKRARAFRRWKLIGRHYGYFHQDTDSRKNRIDDLEYQHEHERSPEKRALLEREIAEVLALYASEDHTRAEKLRSQGKLDEALNVANRGLSKWAESSDLHHLKSQIHSELAARSARQGLDAEPSDMALQAQSSILGATSQLRAHLIARGTAPEQILAEIEALIAGETGDFDLESFRAQALANLAPRAELPENAKHFLATGEFLASQSSTGFDYSAIATQFSKAVEVSLAAEVFERWRTTTPEEIFDEPTRDGDERLQGLVSYVEQGRKLTLGQMAFYLRFARNSTSNRKSAPTLDSLALFLESTRDRGARVDELLESLRQEDIDRFRNGAAHGTRFDRSRALETRGWAYQLLNIVGSLRS